MSAETRKTRDFFILAFALFYPLAMTAVYFVWGVNYAPDAAKTIYAVGKALQFVFPVAITTLVLKERTLVRKPNRRGLLFGALFGLAVGLTIYYAARYGLTSSAIRDSELVSSLRAEFGARAKSFGLTSKSAFAAVAIFYSIIHSGLEEYYWRWFTFGRLSRFFSFVPAAVLCAIAFTLHHIVVLGTYFGYSSALTWVCAFGVGVGGFVWQTLYHKTDSIYGGWVSHGLVDAGIYAVGFLLIS